MPKRNKIIAGLALVIITFTAMGLFGFFRKKDRELKPAAPPKEQATSGPYKDDANNLIYELLFCDDPGLFRKHAKQPYTYPFDILFSQNSSAADVRKIIEDRSADPRAKILAYNKLRNAGEKVEQKLLLAVIVEVGLDDGLDVLASFNNGTARYLNQTGKMLIWETTEDETANKLTRELFAASQQVVNQIGRRDEPRLSHPQKGEARITFLASDGLYFGEGPIDVLFNDPMDATAMNKATLLLQYITEKSLEHK